MDDPTVTNGPPTSLGTALLLQNIADFPSVSMRRYAQSLAAAMTQSVPQIRVEFPAVHQPGALGKVVGRANASRWGRLVRYPAIVRRLRRELRPDVTHVLDHSHANLLRACDPARSVVTVHDVIPMLSVRGELNFSVGRSVGYTFRRKLKLIAGCRRIVTISECTRQQLLRFIDVPPERVKVVYYGVSAGFVPEPAGLGRGEERRRVLARYGIDPSRKVVLHVFTRNRYKNNPTLIRAIAKLPDDVVLLRVGADLFDDEADLVRQLRLESRVVNVGPVSGDANLAEHYRAADVFAFPSTFEGFGWPPLEAMACGTPVVTSNAASLPEVVGDAGLQVDPMDHDGLAVAIDRLLGDPTEAARFGQAALARAAGFTWDACARHTAAVYGEVVQSNH